MSKEFLSVQNLSVEFAKGKSVVQAVNGLSFTLAKGETLGLVGETGAGKTTTALSIMNLVPGPAGRIVSGEILLDGENVLKMSKLKLRKMRGRDVSMVFQDPMTALNPVMTVGDQITEMIRLHSECKASEAVVRAQQMLETVGIGANRFHEYPHQFSGGMKQRVVIAIALACNPKLLIADEPTTALDVTIQAQVLAMIRELRDRLGTSMLMITHDLGIVAQTCDDVGVMYAGEIIESGTVEDIFLGDRHHPYTVGLFDSIPNLTSRATRLKPIPGLMPDPTALPDGCVFADRCSHCMEICSTQHPQVYTNGTHKLCCHLFDKELERGGQENGTQD